MQLLWHIGDRMRLHCMFSFTSVMLQCQMHCSGSHSQARCSAFTPSVSLSQGTSNLGCGMMCQSLGSISQILTHFVVHLGSTLKNCCASVNLDNQFARICVKCNCHSTFDNESFFFTVMFHLCVVQGSAHPTQ